MGKFTEQELDNMRESLFFNLKQAKECGLVMVFACVSRILDLTMGRGDSMTMYEESMPLVNEFLKGLIGGNIPNHKENISEFDRSQAIKLLRLVLPVIDDPFRLARMYGSDGCGLVCDDMYRRHCADGTNCFYDYSAMDILKVLIVARIEEVLSLITDYEELFDLKSRTAVHYPGVPDDYWDPRPEEIESMGCLEKLAEAQLPKVFLRQVEILSKPKSDFPSVLLKNVVSEIVESKSVPLWVDKLEIIRTLKGLNADKAKTEGEGSAP